MRNCTFYHQGRHVSPYRVYLEKQRMHRQKQAKFAQKQSEVGKFKHLVVSPSTDSRWAEDSYFYPINERDYSHEEVCPIPSSYKSKQSSIDFER